MESSNVLLLLEQLDDQIDDLSDSLVEYQKASLVDTASKMPLLDKAKLYVLVTYAIESILFSYLRLNGVKAREHPVFKELNRVKQYFDKIKNAEVPVQTRENLAIDKLAAARFIKAGLAGNGKYDLVHAEHQAKEAARAHIKMELHNQRNQSKSMTWDSLDADERLNASGSDSTSSTGNKSSDAHALPSSKRKADALTIDIRDESSSQNFDANLELEPAKPSSKNRLNKRKQKRSKSKP